MGLNLNIPIRNRVAKADQYRSELEYRQAELRQQQLKKQIRIEVRNAQYALEQSRARVQAAKKARDLAQKDVHDHAEGAGPGRGIELPDADRAARPRCGRTRPGERPTPPTRSRKWSCSAPPAPPWRIMEFKCRTRSMASRLRESTLPRTQAQSNRAELRPETSRNRRVPARILAADDQPHILEAIELLLRPEGYVVDTAKSPAAVRESLACEFYDAVLIDLNYTRDTTSGQEGLDLLSQIVAYRQQPAGDRDDGVGQRRTGRRSHAPRRPRLHPEALGERAPAGHHSHAGRIASRPAAHAASGSRSPAAARRRRSGVHRLGALRCSRCCKPWRASARPTPTCW